MNDLFLKLAGLLVAASTIYGVAKLIASEFSVGKSRMKKLETEQSNLKEECEKYKKRMGDMEEDIAHHERRINKLIDRLIEKSDF